MTENYYLNVDTKGSDQTPEGNIKNILNLHAQLYGTRNESPEHLKKFQYVEDAAIIYFLKNPIARDVCKIPTGTSDRLQVEQIMQKTIQR